MPSLFPENEPYDRGMLDVGDGQRIYWEACGDPAGKPALMLHGGPGSGCTPGMRRYFDPSRYRAILFDQRGSGRSLPHAGDPAVDLSTNTTPHLLADIEMLRAHLGVERWVLFGISWGVTLGLAYAESHPGRVEAMVLALGGLTQPADIHWLYHGVGRYFPDAWARFRAGAGVSNPDANLVHAYRDLLASPDPAVREKAALDWCDWEAAVISIDPKARRPARYEDPQFRMGFARIVTWYFSHDAWLDDGQLLRDVGRLASIPSVLVNGGLDLGGRRDDADERLLADAWPGSELVVIDKAGHETATSGVTEAIVAALDRFASVGG
jgi:proline iminopeptidase